MKIGIGYDVHKFAQERKLILGGVEIPYRLGLLGHSDADVLVHAVIDAILGAAKLGDIGRLFPDTDASYKDISSLKLLSEAGHILYKEGYSIENIDCIICAEAPKIAPYALEMERNIANALNIPPDTVGVKGKTEEGLGFTGRGEGISAQAVCLIEKRGEPRFLKT